MKRHGGWLQVIVRPRCGAPLVHTVQQLEALLELGLSHPSSKAVNEQSAVWRRVARGLGVEVQERLFDAYQVVALSGSKRGLEPLKMLAALEGVSAERKSILLEFLSTALPEAPRWALESYLWCAGRVCARLPLSRRQEWVLPPARIEALLDVVAVLPTERVNRRHGWCILQGARINGAGELIAPQRHGSDCGARLRQGLRLRLSGL